MTRATLIAALLAFPSIALAQDRVNMLERACENKLASHQELVAELSAMGFNSSALCGCAVPIIVNSGLNSSDVTNFMRSGQLSGNALNVLLKINRACVAAH